MATSNTMNPRNMSLMDSLDEFYAEQEHHQYRKTLKLMATMLQIFGVVLIFITLTNRFVRPLTSNQQTESIEAVASDTWYAAGFYDLRRPQMLPKAERDAATKYGGPITILYERTYESGAHAWRYTLDDGQTWFYPCRNAVIRRGMVSTGDSLIHE